jgi:hypothetical protein
MGSIAESSSESSHIVSFAVKHVAKLIERLPIPRPGSKLSGAHRLFPISAYISSALARSSILTSQGDQILLGNWLAAHNAGTKLSAGTAVIPELAELMFAQHFFTLPIVRRPDPARSSDLSYVNHIFFSGLSDVIGDGVRDLYAPEITRNRSDADSLALMVNQHLAKLIRSTLSEELLDETSSLFESLSRMLFDAGSLFEPSLDNLQGLIIALF